MLIITFMLYNVFLNFNNNLFYNKSFSRLFIYSFSSFVNSFNFSIDDEFLYCVYYLLLILNNKYQIIQFAFWVNAFEFLKLLFEILLNDVFFNFRARSRDE